MFTQLDSNDRFSIRGSLSAIALAAMAVVLPACSDPTANTTTNPQGNVTTEDVSENSQQLIGQTVTVRGTVEDVGDRTSFTLDDDRLFGGEDVLVINATGQPFVLPAEDDMAVQVTGEVRQFTLADVEREFNLNLQPTYYTEYEQKPAIVAQSIALSPDPDEVSEDPSRFYGQTVAIEGNVDQVLAANTFKLNDNELVGGSDLLVLNSVTGQPINDGERVLVTGVIRPLVVAEIDREYDLTWDLELQRKLEAEYSNQPVLIATGIYPSAE